MPTEHPEWQIDKLEIQNFRAFETLELSFSSDLTLLIGKNGSGKTTVLDALAIALREPVRELASGTPDTQKIERSDVRQDLSRLDSINDIAELEPVYPCSISISGIFDGDAMSWERTLAHSRSHTSTIPAPLKNRFQSLTDAAANVATSSDITLPVIAYYGVERMISSLSASQKLRFSRKGAYDWALDPRSALKHTLSYLRTLDEQIVRAKRFDDEEPTTALRQHKAIELAAESMLRPLGWKSLRWNSTLENFVMEHPQHGARPIRDLPSGAKIAVGLALDVASRMTRANPHLNEHEVLLNTQGIVLVDEIDLHLHPSWQKTIVPQLRETFPSIQWVLTTHSPQVIGSVEAKNIRGIDVTGEVFTPPFSQGVKPEVVLEKIQGTKPEPVAPIREKLEKYMTLVYEGQGLTSQAVEMRRTLDTNLGGSKWEEQLRKADAILAFEGA